MILTEEDITKTDDVLKYSVTKCFNYLSYIKDKRTREMNAIKQAREKTVRR
tara:strand:- start:4621 stop:4773 length:153 start_codon:yes stop_codon:yes gene_type:complete